jgi:hypothetical protein
MGQARTDYTSVGSFAELAKRAKDAAQVRRLLGLAACSTAHHVNGRRYGPPDVAGAASLERIGLPRIRRTHVAHAQTLVP